MPGQTPPGSRRTGGLPAPDGDGARDQSGGDPDRGILEPGSSQRGAAAACWPRLRRRARRWSARRATWAAGTGRGRRLGPARFLRRASSLCRPRAFPMPGAPCSSWRIRISHMPAMPAPPACRCWRMGRTGGPGMPAAAAASSRRCCLRLPGFRLCSWARNSWRTRTGATTAARTA